MAGGKKPSPFKLLNFKKCFIVISFAKDRPVDNLVTKRHILTMKIQQLPHLVQP